MFSPPVVTRHRVSPPTAVFLRPEVAAVSELIPREVLLIPVAVRLNEQHPTEVFPEVLLVVPLIVPKAVGVAGRVESEATQAVPFHVLRVAGVVLVSFQSWPVTGPEGAVVPTVVLWGTQAEPFQTLATAGVEVVSFQS